MNPEEKKWFQEGSKYPIPKEVCEAHKVPSPQTVEEINNIKVNFARMEEKLQNGFSNLSEKIDALTTLVEKIDEKKADKYLVWWLYGIIASVLGGVLINFFSK